MTLYLDLFVCDPPIIFSLMFLISRATNFTFKFLFLTPESRMFWNLVL